MNKSLKYDSLQFHELDLNNVDNLDLLLTKCEEILYEIRTKFNFTTHFYKDYETIPSTINSLLEYTGGNCITMSKLAVILLRANNINATLIPTTIPKRLQRQYQEEIAHCACCIFVIPNIYIILDPAFYFINPLVIIENSVLKPVITATNDRGEINSKLLTNNKPGQIIPVNTKYIECTKNNDTWCYYLIGIQNPDETIGLNHRICLEVNNENIYVEKKNA